VPEIAESGGFGRTVARFYVPPNDPETGEHVDADGNPDLSFHGVLGSAVEMLDA
jgi:hypothetical protein